jgi:hypothetical protein
MQVRFRPPGLIWIAAAALLLAALPAGQLIATEEEGWPREINAKGAKIVIYQPQPESFVDDDLRARAAVGVQENDEAEPVFGAVWFVARVETDRDEREVRLIDVKVPRVHFPEASEEEEKKLIDVLKKEISKWEGSISLDQLLVSLEEAEREQVAADSLRTEPPTILFSTEPAILIMIDGEPSLQATDDERCMRVINTPFLMVLDTSTGDYYLDGGDDWYAARSATGPWEHVDGVPLEVLKLRPPPDPDAAEEEEPAEEEADDEEPPDNRIPRIIVATEPTELIVSDGEPTWSPIGDLPLLYMGNTESDVILDVKTQRRFIILSGRWYASKSMEGPWTYVPSNEVPPAFGRIPPESEVGHLLVFVAGTELAEEAVLDSQIPQTSAIKRSTTLVVTYDGKPEFKKIDDVDLKYAVNTTFAVIKHNRQYYACDEAVWFVADDPLGPWIVATEIPVEIYTIPPSFPIYNIKYVRIYYVTDDLVYTGYLPGYTGTYVQNETIVYGTGYYYPPYHGTIYVAYPATWGWHVRWNPWYGWGFGFSYSTGRFTIRIGWGGHRYGWWGPGRYHGYRRGYHRGWHHGYRAGARAGYRAGARHSYRNNNIYRNQNNRQRNAATQPRAGTGGAQPNRGTPSKQPNNVYADRNGNVYRKQGDQWQKRDGGGWSASDSPGGGARPSTSDQRGQRDAGKGTGQRGQPSSRQSGQPSTRPSGGGYGSGSGGSNLDRSYNNRQRGSQRSQSYQHSRGGGGRGGGGRRR